MYNTIYVTCYVIHSPVHIMISSPQFSQLQNKRRGFTHNNFRKRRKASPGKGYFMSYVRVLESKKNKKMAADVFVIRKIHRIDKTQCLPLEIFPIVSFL